jgi:hypothetical protein
MPSITETLSILQVYFKRIVRLQEDLADCLNSPLPKPKKDEIQAEIGEDIQNYEARQAKALDELVTFPPQHLRHFPKLVEFHNNAPYEKSVFIMTKFPEGNTALDAELERVIKAVQDAVTACGFTPRIASEKKYHAGLWDNVEVYLFGCQRGIAIVESKYLHELNPNVTMEWGWMRGMGKDVLYLVEDSFDSGRADISGLLQDRFLWAAPEPKITKAIHDWLKP